MGTGIRFKAGMMAMVLSIVCLLFCGCSPVPLLSQREIVRAVFFQQNGTKSTALLLLADGTQSSSEGEPAYKSSAGSGQNPVQALEQAESRLEGQVFYGLMDLAILPSPSGWEDTQALARLLYAKTKPSPRITVFLMEGQTQMNGTDAAAALYEEIKNGCARYGVENGLQTVLADKNECALPVWQGTEYGFAFLQQGKPEQVLEDPLAAQLAAVLCGQADRLDGRFAQGSASVQARTALQHKADRQGRNELHLTLTDPEFQDLSEAGRGEDRLYETLCDELQQVFSEMTDILHTDTFDPLQTEVWVSAEMGISARIPVPQLVVHKDA